MSQPTCRFCLEELDLSHPEELLSPCACDGSQKYLHTNCFRDWIAKSNVTKCSVCQFSYPMISEPNSNKQDDINVLINQIEDHPNLSPEEVALRDRIAAKMGYSIRFEWLVNQLYSPAQREWVDANFEEITDLFMSMSEEVYPHYRMNEEDLNLYLELDRKLPHHHMILPYSFRMFAHEPYRTFVHQHRTLFLEWEILVSENSYKLLWTPIWNGDQLYDDAGVCPDVIQRIGKKIGRCSLVTCISKKKLTPSTIKVLEQHEEVLTQYFQHRTRDLFSNQFLSDQSKLESIIGSWWLSPETVTFLMEGIDNLDNIPSNTNLGIVMKWRQPENMENIIDRWTKRYKKSWFSTFMTISLWWEMYRMFGCNVAMCFLIPIPFAIIADVFLILGKMYLGIKKVLQMLYHEWGGWTLMVVLGVGLYYAMLTFQRIETEFAILAF